MDESEMWVEKTISINFMAMPEHFPLQYLYPFEYIKHYIVKTIEPHVPWDVKVKFFLFYLFRHSWPCEGISIHCFVGASEFQAWDTAPPNRAVAHSDLSPASVIADAFISDREREQWWVELEANAYS